MMPLMTFIGNFGYVAVCVLGAVLAANGSITFGVIVSFMIYVRLFTQPLSQIAQVFTSLQSTLAASERVFDFLGEEELEDESAKESRLQNVHGNVEFKNVQFGYTPNKTIIHDFNAKVKAGQTVAIVGPTGAGKTTLVNLLMPNTVMPTKRIASGLLQRSSAFCRMKPTSAHWYRGSKARHTTKSSRWSSGHLLNGFASLTPMSR